MAGERVLVVDDEEDVLALFLSVLGGEGYAVDVAKNGVEALQAMGRESYSLVIVDMRMPVLGGHDLVMVLRERAILVPILAMSVSREGRRWAEEIGARGFLEKPFDLDRLLGLVRYLCSLPIREGSIGPSSEPGT